MVSISKLLQQLVPLMPTRDSSEPFLENVPTSKVLLEEKQRGWNLTHFDVDIWYISLV